MQGIYRRTDCAASRQRQVIRVQREAVAPLEIRLQGQHMTVGDLDVLAALLAHQMMMVLARSPIFVLLFSFAGADRRDEADSLEPLQGAVHRGYVDVRLHGHDRSMDRLSGHMLCVDLDHLKHLKALWRQAMALPTEECGLFGYTLFTVPQGIRAFRASTPAAHSAH